jgi:hypothetical protein
MLSFSSANTIASFSDNDYLYYRCWRVDSETYQFAFEKADDIISHLSAKSILATKLENAATSDYGVYSRLPSGIGYGFNEIDTTSKFATITRSQPVITVGSISTSNSAANN